MDMNKFEVGKTYSGRFATNWDSIASFTIEARTAKTVTTKVHGKTVTRRLSDRDGVEMFKPFGSYSMAMVIWASCPDLSQPDLNQYLSQAT
jgi:hypothetical protein